MKNTLILILTILVLSNVKAQDRFFEFVDGWINTYCFEYDENYLYMGLGIGDEPLDHYYLYNRISDQGLMIDQTIFELDSSYSTTTRIKSSMATFINDEELIVCGSVVEEEGGEPKGTLVKYNIETSEFDLLGSYEIYLNTQFTTVKKINNEELLVGALLSDGDLDLGLFLIDMEGVIQWQQIFSCGNLCFTRPQETLTLQTGEHVLLASEFDSDTPAFSERLSTVLIKTDTFGEELWRVYPGDHENHWISPGGIVEQDDGILVAYTDPKFYGLDDGEWHFNHSSTVHLSKYTLEGDFLWSISLLEDIPNAVDLTPSTYEYFVHQLQHLSDGNILVSGTAGRPGFMAKLTEMGELVWFREYSPHPLEDNNALSFHTHLYNVSSTSDGGFIAAGQYFSDPGNLYPSGIQTAIAIKVDEFGCLEPGCQVNDPTSVEALSINFNFLKIYPNPANNDIRIESNSVISEINILDLLGHRIIQMSIVENTSSTIDLSQLKRGVYFVNLKIGASYFNRKFIKN